MGFALGHKIDMRLKAFEDRIAQIEKRVTELEKVSKTDTQEVHGADNPVAVHVEVIPKRRGRPPKATNG